MKRTDAVKISIPGDRFTPFSLAKKLGALAVLESASFAHGKDRYSILLLDEAFRIIQDDLGISFIINGDRKRYDQTDMVIGDKTPIFLMFYYMLQSRILCLQKVFLFLVQESVI